jgi:hypothetical protein
MTVGLTEIYTASRVGCTTELAYQASQGRRPVAMAKHNVGYDTTPAERWQTQRGVQSQVKLGSAKVWERVLGDGRIIIFLKGVRSTRLGKWDDGSRRENRQC